MIEVVASPLAATPSEPDTPSYLRSVPAGWRVVALNDEGLFQFETGIWTGKKQPLVECPVVRNTNFRNDGFFDWSDVAKISIEERQLERKRLRWGDIVIERSGGGPTQPVGRVALFDRSDGNWCFSNFTSRLRVVDPAVVDPEYLHRFLHFFHQSGETERLQRRTTGIRNLAFSDYQASLIPLPPPPAQRAIVKALRAVQNAIGARRREADLERERKVTLMRHLFAYGTELGPERQQETRYGSVPARWQVMVLADCARVQTGVAKGRKYDGVGTVEVPYLRVANVQDGYLDLSEMKTITVAEREMDRFRLKDGDVVLTEGGDFDKLGRGFIWRGQIADCVHQNHVFAVRVRPEVLLPEYLAYLAQSPYGRAYFLSVAHKTTNLACINTAKLKAMPVPVPSKEEQRDIVSALDACDKKLEAVVKEQKALDELLRALLDDLMTGRLSADPLIDKAEAP